MGGINKTWFGLVKVLHLNNAQIIALGDSFIEMVPARADTAWIPLALSIAWTNWVADYVADVAALIGPDYPSGDLFAAGVNETATVILAPGQAVFEVIPNFFYEVLNNSVDVNAPLRLVLDNNGMGPLTGGNALNTITVKMFYLEVLQ